MTTIDKFREILQRLLEKSKADKVAWRAGPNDAFYVQIDRISRITVRYDSPQSSPDFADAEFWMDSTRVAGLGAEDGNEDWELLSGLYDEAKRGALGWDVALERIEKALLSNDTIGLPDYEGGQVPF